MASKKISMKKELEKIKIDKIVSGNLNNNTYILSKNKECIIIDCSCSLEQIKIKTKNLKVLGVLLTHGHYDHFVSLESVINYFNVNCYVSSLDLEKLFSPKMNYSIVLNKFYSVKLPQNKFTLLPHKKGKFKLGCFDISYYLTPGHTNGSLCFLIDNFLFTGDTLFSGSYGRCDLITGNKTDMINSLKFLRNKFLGFTIYPGHDSEGTVE